MDDLYRLSDSLHSKYHYIGTVQNNKFHCPYCGKWKENEDMGYREEVVGSSFDFPWYLPNHVKITSYTRDMHLFAVHAYRALWRQVKKLLIGL